RRRQVELARRVILWVHPRSTGWRPPVKGYPPAVASKPPNERREELVSVYREMCDGHACPLKDVRTKLVFGAGNANADLMFVGEAPGANEDKQGLPFVGRAGQLLNQLLE